MKLFNHPSVIINCTPPLSSHLYNSPAQKLFYKERFRCRVFEWLITTIPICAYIIATASLGTKLTTTQMENFSGLHADLLASGVHSDLLPTAKIKCCVLSQLSPDSTRNNPTSSAWPQVLHLPKSLLAIMSTTENLTHRHSSPAYSNHPAQWMHAP